MLNYSDLQSLLKARWLLLVPLCFLLFINDIRWLWRVDVSHSEADILIACWEDAVYEYTKILSCVCSLFTVFPVVIASIISHLSSKQQMVDLCQQSFLYRKCSPERIPDALVEKYSTLLSISTKETRQCICTLGNLIKTALFQGSSEPQDIIALFPSNFHKSLRDLITRIILDNMTVWKADAVNSQGKLIDQSQSESCDVQEV